MLSLKHHVLLPLLFILKCFSESSVIRSLKLQLFFSSVKTQEKKGRSPFGGKKKIAAQEASTSNPGASSMQRSDLQ